MKKLFVVFALSLNLCFATALPKQTLKVANNSEINYYKVGQGKPIVLLMGYGLTNNFWPKPFIHCLSQNHTVYILDYINIDKPSMDLIVDEINAFIIKANLDHPEVIGWSMGGGMALSLANKYPHSISKIGVISSIVADPGVSQIVTPYQAVNDSDDERLNYVFGNNIYKYKSKHLAHYKTKFLNKNKTVFVNDKTLKLQQAALANWMADEDNYAMMSHIDVPANVVVASHDAILNPQVELYAFKNYPNKYITVIGNSGHASFYQHPQEVCKAVLY